MSRVDAYLTAGLSAGFASTSLLYPLEVIHLAQCVRHGGAFSSLTGLRDAPTAFQVIRTQFQANQHKQRRTFVAVSEMRSISPAYVVS